VEVFDWALPLVTLPTHTPGDLLSSPVTDALRDVALAAVDELNPDFCSFARFFLSSDIDFLPDADTTITLDTLAKLISIVSSVVDLGLGSRHGPDGAVLHPSNWLRLARHLLAAILHGALRSEALNAQLQFELLNEDEWALTDDLSHPDMEGAALAVLTQQLLELVAPGGLGQSVIAYYDRTRLDLTKEIERVKETALQALHDELKADPKINSHTWDSALS